MKKENKLLLKILKSSIRDNKIINIEDKNIDWKYFISMAMSNNVLTVIYSYMDTTKIRDIFLKTVSVRNIVRNMRINEIHNINILKEIVNRLADKNIKIIVLKGMAVRKYYSVPENRVMSDIDILIKEQDYKEILDTLIEMGYMESHESHPIHKSFYSKDKIEIEAHIKLINNDEYYNGNVEEFEKGLWSRSVVSDFYNLKINTLCVEDTIIYLSIHMSVHIKYGGFSLSQLYDLALIIEKEKDYINWDSIIDKMNKYSIKRFFAGVALFLNKEWDIDIPQCILLYSRKNDIKMLYKYIFLIKNEFDKNQSRYYDILCRYDKEHRCMINSVRRIKQFVFPSVNKLRQQYSYVKNISILLIPVAWIHHIFRALYIEKFNVLLILKNIIKSISIGYIRQKTINKFQL